MFRMARTLMDAKMSALMNTETGKLTQSRSCHPGAGRAGSGSLQWDAAGLHVGTC